ncbi:unnamed protein product, partial [Ilex paraguariensis]
EIFCPKSDLTLPHASVCVWPLIRFPLTQQAYSTQVIFEGVYALHPYIRKSLDLWIVVVGGVHSHLISRVQRNKSRVGCFMSQNEIMTTVFPMFQQHIEPHLVHAHATWNTC